MKLAGGQLTEDGVAGRKAEDQPSVLRRLSSHRWAVLICVAFLALGVAYNFANPPFEATDEIRHFRYVRYLTLNHALPPVSAETSREMQAHHPPLYYALAALITAPVPSPAGADYSAPVNPFWGFRYFEPSIDNKAQYLHTPDERWQFTGVTLIVYLARALSLLFGLGTVLITYRLGRDLFPGHSSLALGAMAFVAFNPMLLHGSVSVNNDTAAAFFGAWAIAESAATAERGASLRRAAALGVALGLGILSKASVLPLAAVAAAAFAVRLAGADRKRPAAWGAFALAALVALGICGWWFARNFIATGDAMGLRDYQSAWVGQADRARLIRDALSGLPYAWTTFWARFDYGQIVLPAWVYEAWAVLCALAVPGLLRTRHRLRSAGVGIAALSVVVSLAGWGALMLTIPATANARLVLQIFPALGLLLVLGWRGLLPKRHRESRLLALAVGGLALCFSLVALLGYLAPAFAYPPAVAALPPTATHAPVGANFEGVAEIVGYRLTAQSARPGDQVDVTIYWKPLAQTDAPLQVFVHFVDEDGIISAQRDTYPGLGNAVTRWWRAGATFADTYRVFVPPTAYAPQRLTVRVGLWDPAANRPLLTSDADALTIGTLALTPGQGALPNPVSINFANRMTLVGYDLDSRAPAPGDTVRLTTHWLAVDPDSDYWAYAHIVGADGRIWAIADSVITPPVTGWPRGAVQAETRSITLAPDTPPGQYTIEFGLTRRDNGLDRLSVLAADGHEIGDHIELTFIRVQAP